MEQQGDKSTEWREKIEKEFETQRGKRIRRTLKIKNDYYKTQRDGYKHLNAQVWQ